LPHRLSENIACCQPKKKENPTRKRGGGVGTAKSLAYPVFKLPNSGGHTERRQRGGKKWERVGEKGKDVVGQKKQAPTHQSRGSNPLVTRSSVKGRQTSKVKDKGKITKEAEWKQQLNTTTKRPRTGEVGSHHNKTRQVIPKQKNTEEIKSGTKKKKREISAKARWVRSGEFGGGN